ncbi:MAG: peptidylprolyl isomerase [Alphaproteobacteria bacterium]|nr:peptidylprolyl isomerase [Alphaproteobacteria bacterium]
MTTPKLTPPSTIFQRKWLLAVVVVAVVGGALWYSQQKASQSSDPLVAKVDGMAITRADLEAFKEQLPPFVRQQPTEALYPKLVNRLIDNKLALSKAKAAGIDKDEEVRRQITEAQESIMVQAWIRREVDKKLTDDLLKQSYQDEVKVYKPEDQVRARHILVATKDEADKLLARINKGEDFAALAKEASKDGSAADGGDLGFFSHDRMVKPFADAAFALKQGDVVKAPVQTQFGWHLIKVEGRRQSEAPSFEDSKEELKQKMSGQTVQTVIEDLRKNAKIERFDLEGKPLKTSDKADDKTTEEGAAEPQPKP